MDARTILANARVSAHFAAERRERQQRQGLVAADFAQLREAGFPLVGVPVDHGGIWESVRRSTRPLCELLRTLAHGDSSVALVCAMHPTVLVFWMANSQVPPPFQAAWEAQRRHIFQTVREGAWWGTITSEPGSGGDRQDSSRRAPWAEGWSLPAQRPEVIWQRVEGDVLHD
jgi:alkylation response protein AidB-like acyl-CoA dehydrogenase